MPMLIAMGLLLPLVMFNSGDGIIVQALCIVSEYNVGLNIFPACFDTVIGMFSGFFCVREFLPYPFCDGIVYMLHEFVGRAAFQCQVSLDNNRFYGIAGF